MKSVSSLISETSPSIGNSFGPIVFLSYRCPVPVRVNAAKDLGVSRSEAYRALIRVIVITCVPVLGTLLAIVSTTEPDLSHLTPIRRAPDGYVLLNWFALQQGRISSEASAQALGYMVESDRARHTGEWVRDFVLLPDAGNLLHPAHRIPDQMIAIRLRESEQIQFSPRSLVWVWGMFRESPADPAGIQPLYHLDEARVKRADKADIAKYFR
jgi:hypothetical protein